MKFKNLYFILLAILFVASSCSENTDLAPVIDQTVDVESLNKVRGESYSEDFWDCINNPGNACVDIDYDDSPDNEEIVTDIDTGHESVISPDKKWKNKSLTDCSYFEAAGYSCTSTEMLNFILIFQRAMSDSEWQIYESMSKAQRSKYVLNARIAFDKAAEVYPNFAKNSKGDAFRQGLNSALNARDLGQSLTQSLESASQNRPAGTGNTPLENQMANHNYAFGKTLLYNGSPSLGTLIIRVNHFTNYGNFKYINGFQLIPTNQ